MDNRDARHMMANLPVGPGTKVGEQRPSRSDGDSYFSRNTKEDAIIEAIDQKELLVKYADWIQKLQDGKIDVTQFLGALSPDMALELAKMAFGGKSEKVRLAAITDFLDRAGYSKVHKVATAHLDPNTSKEQLISMIEGMARKTKTVEIIDDDPDQSK